MAGSDLQTREVARKVRGEVGVRLEWYEKVQGAALRFLTLVNGAGLVTTIIFTCFLIQFRRPPSMALNPAVAFAVGLLAIGLFHLGHAWVIRGWAASRLKIRRVDDDEFVFVDDPNMLRRLFSHLQLWPIAVGGGCALLGVLSGLMAVYRA